MFRVDVGGLERVTTDKERIPWGVEQSWTYSLLVWFAATSPATAKFKSKSDNYGPISYRLKDKRRFRSKISKFSHPVHLTSPLRGFPSEFCNKKTTCKVMPYQRVEWMWRYVHSFRYSIRAWRTDGRTEMPQQYRVLHALACWRAIKS